MAGRCFQDEEFGNVEVRYSSNAKRMILRYKEGGFYITIPPGVGIKSALQFFNDNRDFCRKALENTKIKRPEDNLFDEHTKWKSLTFKLKISSTKMSQHYYRFTDGILYFYYPQKCDIYSKNTQSIVKKLLDNVLRSEAKIFLTNRLKMLAEKHGFQYKSCTVRSSTSRWGSCTSHKNINLSYYLMMLSIELVDYVLLHELCHLKEMNHSPQFWALLDSLVGGNAKKYRQKLKKYTPSI